MNNAAAKCNQVSKRSTQLSSNGTSNRGSVEGREAQNGRPTRQRAWKRQKQADILSAGRICWTDTLPTKMSIPGIADADVVPARSRPEGPTLSAVPCVLRTLNSYWNRVFVLELSTTPRERPSVSSLTSPKQYSKGRSYGALSSSLETSATPSDCIICFSQSLSASIIVCGAQATQSNRGVATQRNPQMA